MMPLVSVAMSVHNALPWLPRSIESILSQSYREIEFIIVDDGSSDGSSDVIQRYGDDDARIKVIRNDENYGLTRSLNRAISASSGAYVARQDADDWSHGDRLMKQVAFMTGHPDVALVGTSAYLVDDSGTLAIERVMSGARMIGKHLIRRNLFIHGSVLFRRKPLIDIGMYREKYLRAQDYDIFLRMSEKYRLDNLTEPLYYYRMSPGAISSRYARDQQLLAMSARQEACYRRGLGRMPAPGAAARDVRLADSHVQTDMGRYHMLKRQKAQAIRHFARAFHLFPTPKKALHLMRAIIA